MTVFSPVYRVRVNGYTVTDATLSGLTVTSGRTDIYSQPVAGYANITLIETAQASIPYEINDPISVEVQDSIAEIRFYHHSQPILLMILFRHLTPACSLTKG